MAATAAAAVALALPAPAHVNPWPDTPKPATVAGKRVGGIVLQPCAESGAYCGRLERPLDPTGHVSGSVSIYFQFYPHSRPGKSAGTLVATEGGPGYPATESRGEYLALFKPLMTERDVVIMDNRGTGQSGAVECRALQTAERWTTELVAACGESLGARAPLYSTAYAADDLAAVLQTLGVGKIDLYGDSYGTYFEQVFATRHPEALRSLVLDGAYPLTGTDYAWYANYAPAMRDKFDLACARSAACARVPGTSIEHIAPALAQLRAWPFPARAVDVDGKSRVFRADASQLAAVMFGSAPALTTVRETDAAARAFAQGDRLPLLRLMAEAASAMDSRDPTGDAGQWSAGLAAAVMCQDPPQIFDMRLAPAQRAVDRERALIARRRAAPDTYAPFTIDEYRGLPLDYGFLDQCVGWPVAPADHPSGQLGMGAVYPDVPALIVSGDLDNMTPLADGAAVAAAFKRGTQVRIANGFHVNALPHSRSACAADLVRRFMTTATPGDLSCAAAVPPVRLVPQFAVRAQELEPVAASAGNQASPAQLRVAAAALLTVGDVLARVSSNTSGHDAGLRGGTFGVARHGERIELTLDQVRWVDDVSVSGSVERPRGRDGAVSATLNVSGTEQGRLTVSWREGGDAVMATVAGTLGGAKVAAQSPAP